MYYYVFCYKNGIFNVGYEFKLVISLLKLIRYEYYFLYFGIVILDISVFFN